jgi:hypothetical protein
VFVGGSKKSPTTSCSFSKKKDQSVTGTTVQGRRTEVIENKIIQSKYDFSMNSKRHL